MWRLIRSTASVTCTKASSILSSPNTQMGSFEGIPSHVRRYGIRDVVGGCVDKVIVSTGDHDGVMVVMEVLELARVVVLALVVVRAMVFTEKEGFL
ncbi:hypothetical protein F0562_030076 [Nyssa sinensis]|uniref:Uncharacterized protein n=1 Tax=Nyssa sinensis TaxID=561372 RepID=A0A5J5AVZ7_9ASTE|nr:hypothetical protein F0562_030076 [Nyssa sinensis]